MTKMTHFLAKPLIAVALLGTLGGAAYAQTAAPAAASQASPADALKNELKITAAQESAWKQFTDTYALPFKPTQEMTGAQFNAMKTPERIAFLKKLRLEETSFLAGRLDASLALYSKLDDSQKAIFDNMTAQPVAAAQPQQGAAKAPAKAKKK